LNTHIVVVDPQVSLLVTLIAVHPASGNLSAIDKSAFIDPADSRNRSPGVFSSHVTITPLPATKNSSGVMEMIFPPVLGQGPSLRFDHPNV
jgi:hypothetical protein